MSPKIASIPSRAQARILKALTTHNGLRIIWNGKSRGEWVGTNWPNVAREIGQPMQSTLRKLKMEEWIEPDEEGSIFWVASEAGEAALEEYGMPEATFTHLTADDLLKAIRRMVGPTVAVIPEMPIKYPSTPVTIRRVDAFAIDAAGMTWAFEIKVSRSDWLKELADIRKHMPAREIATYFNFVAPKGIIKPSEVPEGCGLLEYEHAGLTRTVYANVEHRNQPTWELVGEIAVRLAKA